MPEKPNTENLSAEDIMTLQSGIAAFETKQFVRAHELLSALSGHPEAQYRLAIMAQNGLGMVVNEKNAAHWMRTAAEQGFDLAQHGLGFMYMEGECVEQNYSQAIHWFSLAAEQGLAGAQTTLGNLYEQGRGVEKDLDEAKRWYAKAGF
ncbi:Sel1 domain protein repeat-containing protein [Candidatus Thiomargarita nelsonii]|uniref:Sel1 domain protein repeat-containing protein n=1 Tax=Candidatus Thiomargarita nelsonii TaxID=1003181 RepID=A0A0A6RSX8_9GAMM|nr:Sel1 domain protein repeat-containing protein [Candidatus Thiomargarita nelsonii]